MLLWVCLGGALGAVMRYLLDYVIVARLRGPFPAGTFVINISGSLALGLVIGLVVASAFPPEAKVVLGTGFLGAYTTFSTWMYQTVRLALDGDWSTASLNALGSLLSGVVAVALGLWVAARLLTRGLV